MLYLIKSGKYVKIGYAKNVQKRLLDYKINYMDSN